MDISDDGQTVLAIEGLWNESTGWVPIPDLPGGTVQNTPRVLSGDGRVVYGNSSSAFGDEIYRWTAEEGIRGLGLAYLRDAQATPPNPLPYVRHSVDTNEDGSLLLGGVRVEGNVRLFQWHAETDTIEWFDMSQLDLFGAPHMLFLAGDASMVAYTGGGIYPLEDLQPLPSNGDVVTIGGDSVSDRFPTAIAGNGRLIATTQWYHGDDYSMLITGLDYTGAMAVGIHYLWDDGVHLPLPFSTRFRVDDGEWEFLSNALARRSVFVDVPPAANALISTDAHSIATEGLRPGRGGASSGRECALATFEELDASQIEASPVAGTLAPPSASCGNGVLDAGETCDDGNVNDADGCTARCRWPALSASSFSTCATGEAGAAWCWGRLTRPLVGTEDRSWSPVAVPALEGVVQLAAGEDHSCAVLEDGRVACWGKGEFGQLGDGSDLGSTTPVPVVGLTDAVQVSVQSERSCAVLGDGSVQCWGANASDPMAPDESADSAVPVEVPNLDLVSQVAHLEYCRSPFARAPGCYCTAPGDACHATGFSTCALRDDASVWCWGVVPAETGELVDSPAPRLVLEGVRQISAGEDHICFLQDAGTARCWGVFSVVGNREEAYESYATLSADISSSDWSWFTLQFPPNTIALAGGLSVHCALTSDGLALCRGRDDAGSHGRGTRDFTGSTMGPVLGITDALNIAAGRAHVCAALADGGIKCWGGDIFGELGIGHRFTHYPSSLSRPIRVPGFPSQ